MCCKLKLSFSELCQKASQLINVMTLKGYFVFLLYVVIIVLTIGFNILLLQYYCNTNFSLLNCAILLMTFQAMIK
jgi:hypothetical protein